MEVLFEESPVANRTARTPRPKVSLLATQEPRCEGTNKFLLHLERAQDTVRHSDGARLERQNRKLL